MEDKKADAVTHLAIARSQNTENGILGVKRITNDKGSCESNCSFFCLNLHINEKKYGQEGSLCIEKNFFDMEGS